MTKPEFVSLHTHTHDSLLDGFSKVDEYINRAVDLGQKGLGVTDHGNMFASYELMEKSRAAGITPVPGIEAYMAPENPLGAKVKGPVFYGPNGEKAPKYDVSSNGAYLHQTLWAINSVGLHNLFKLSTLSYDPERFRNKPRIDFDLLAEYSEGLVVATGCPSSEISTRFMLGQDDKAYEYAGRLKEVFGKDRMFVEIMDHNMSIDLERVLLPKQMELAKKLGLGLLATNDCHYAHKEDSRHHEEFLCIQSESRMSDPTYDEGGRRFAFDGDQFYLKSAEEMNEIFPEKDFPGALSNTLLIAEMAQDVKVEFDPHLKPKPFIPEGFTELDYYKKLLEDGFKERYGTASDEVQKEAKERIRKEFDVIYSSDFIGYMLTVREYLVWTRQNFSTRDEKGDVLALSVGVGRGCFEPGTEIVGHKRNKKIENVKIGEKVRTHDATYQTVENVFEYEVKNEDMIELTLSNGKVIKSTADHMIFQKDRGFVQAQDLNPGDVLLGAKANKELFSYPCGNCGKEITLDKRTYDIRSKKGSYKREGECWCYDCVKHNLHSIPEVRVGSAKGSARNKDKDVKEKMKKALEAHWKEFGDERRERWREYSSSEEYSKICTERNLRRYSDPIKLENLTRIGNRKKYKKGIFVSFNQEGREIHYDSSFELKALNIFETDSTVESFDRCRLRIPYVRSSDGLEHNYLPDFIVEYKDGSKKIIEIKAKWQTSEKETKEKLDQASSTIKDMGYDFEVWTEDELEEKNDFWHNEVVVKEVKKYKYTGKVYDLQVENTHNYTVEGVTVHNSVGGSIHAYLLHISEIDPIRYDLLFERFLSAGRGATYKLTYDDGTTEEVNVSEEKKVISEDGKLKKKYIHQLELGDEIQD